jgi:hypothetical protein
MKKTRREGTLHPDYPTAGGEPRAIPATPDIVGDLNVQGDWLLTQKFERPRQQTGKARFDRELDEQLAVILPLLDGVAMMPGQQSESQGNNDGCYKRDQ